MLSATFQVSKLKKIEKLFLGCDSWNRQYIAEFSLTLDFLCAEDLKCRGMKMDALSQHRFHDLQTFLSFCLVLIA